MGIGVAFNATSAQAESRAVLPQLTFDVVLAGSTDPARIAHRGVATAAAECHIRAAIDAAPRLALKSTALGVAGAGTACIAIAVAGADWTVYPSAAFVGFRVAWFAGAFIAGGAFGGFVATAFR